MSSQVFPSTLPGLLMSLDRDVDFDVTTQTTLTRKELRFTYETIPITKYKLGFEILRSDSSLANRTRELQQVLTHIARHYGQLDSFLLIDLADSSVSDHGFGVGDGSTTAFQLQRTLGGDIIDAYGEWPASTKPRTNLMLRSQEFDNAAWTKGDTSVLANFGAAAPDGTPTADYIAEDTVASVVHFVQQSPTLTSGFRYAKSAFAKPNGRNVELQCKTLDGTFRFAVFDLTAGAVGQTSGVVASGIQVGAGGWCRVWMVFDAGTGAASANEAIILATGTTKASDTYTGDGSSGAWLWGAQTEVIPATGTAPTQYIATTSAAVTVNPTYWPGYADGFEPISDLNGPATYTVEADGLGKRALVQWSRTNLALRSQEFDNASWTKATNTSVTADATAAPDGTTTADKLIENTTANAEHYAEQAVAIAAGLPIANVAYAKAAERTWVYVSAVLRDAATVSGAYFDLTNGVLGTVETGVTASMVPCANGFWRCAIAVNVGAGGSNPRIRIQTASANGTKSYVGVVNSGLFLWGGQSEQGFVAGDYIPTTTATVARTDIAVSSTGAVTASVAPRAAAVLAWSGSYYRRVRFAERNLSVEQMVQSMWSAKAISLISVKP